VHLQWVEFHEEDRKMANVDASIDEEGLGLVATRVIYEDDEVRIWDQVIGPHETLEPHRHVHDYFLVDVKGDGGVLQVEYMPGNARTEREPHPYNVARGNHHFIEKGAVERAINTSDKSVRLILVELLKEAE
jgi:hypothetical protein